MTSKRLWPSTTGRPTAPGSGRVPTAMLSLQSAVVSAPSTPAGLRRRELPVRLRLGARERDEPELDRHRRRLRIDMPRAGPPTARGDDPGGVDRVEVGQHPGE